MADLTDDQLIENNENNARINFAHRMTNSKLMALRAQNPFLAILPFPNEVIAIQLQPGVPTDINLPDQTKMVKFVGNGEYYISRKGNAAVPNSSVNDVNGSSSLMKPEGNFWYVEELRQFSAIAPVTVNLTVMCFVQE